MQAPALTSVGLSRGVHVTHTLARPLHLPQDSFDLVPASSELLNCCPKVRVTTGLPAYLRARPCGSPTHGRVEREADEQGSGCGGDSEGRLPTGGHVPSPQDKPGKDALCMCLPGGNIPGDLIPARPWLTHQEDTVATEDTFRKLYGEGMTLPPPTADHMPRMWDRTGGTVL